MRRARLLLADLLVRAADLLVSEKAPPPPEEEDEEAPMPAGHPVVIRSAKAEQMVIEGARRAPREKKPEPEAPLAGSLQDRMNRGEL